MQQSSGIFRELHAVVVPVPDLEQARAFYAGVLGLEVVREVPGAISVYGTGGETYVCLFLPTEASEGPAAGGAFPNFRCDDIEATRQHLVDRGVDCGPIDASPALSWFPSSDPFGNRFDVCAFGEDWLP